MFRPAATFSATEPRTRLKAWGGAHVLTDQILKYLLFKYINDAQKTIPKKRLLLGEISPDKQLRIEYVDYQTICKLA